MHCGGGGCETERREGPGRAPASCQSDPIDNIDTVAPTKPAACFQLYNGTHTLATETCSRERKHPWDLFAPRRAGVLAWSRVLVVLARSAQPQRIAHTQRIIHAYSSKHWKALFSRTQGCVSRAFPASISVSRTVAASYLPAIFSARNEPTRVHSPALACFLVLQHSMRSCRHWPQRTIHRYQQQRKRRAWYLRIKEAHWSCLAWRTSQHQNSALVKKEIKPVAGSSFCSPSVRRRNSFVQAFCCLAWPIQKHAQRCPRIHDTFVECTNSDTWNLCCSRAYIHTCFGPVVLAIARRRTAPTG